MGLLRRLFGSKPKQEQEPDWYYEPKEFDYSGHGTIAGARKPYIRTDLRTGKRQKVIICSPGMKDRNDYCVDYSGQLHIFSSHPTHKIVEVIVVEDAVVNQYHEDKRREREERKRYMKAREDTKKIWDEVYRDLDSLLES